MNENDMQIKDAIEYSINVLTLSDSKQIDSEVLLCFVLKCNRTKLYTHSKEELSNQNKNIFKKLVKKRAKGCPIAYITNEKEFWSHTLFVNESTLIPRPETELLVEISIKLIKNHSLNEILELGTGSGAVAIAIASENLDTNIDATDINDEAINVATKNILKHNIKNINFIKSNWFNSIGIKKYDLIITNPPYIETNDPCLTNSDIKFEPIIALASGIDGLDDLRKIISNSHNKLKNNGWLVVEHGHNQGDDVRNLFIKNRFTTTTIKDYNQLERVTYGKLI